MNQAPPLQSLGNLRSAFENARQSSAVESAVQESVAASARMADSIMSSKLQKYGMILFAFVLFAAYMINRNYKGAVEKISNNIDGIGGEIKKKKDEVEAVARRIDELDLHQGPQGEPGPKGTKGDKGDAGDDGVCPEDCQGAEGSGAVDGMSLNYAGVEDFETNSICFHSKDGYGKIIENGKLKHSDVDCEDDDLLLTAKDYLKLKRGLQFDDEKPVEMIEDSGHQGNPYYFTDKTSSTDEINEDWGFYNTRLKINLKSNEATSKNYNLLVGGPTGVKHGPLTLDSGYSIGFTSPKASYKDGTNDDTYKGFINTRDDGHVQLQGCQDGSNTKSCINQRSSIVDLFQDKVTIRNGQNNVGGRVCVSSSELTANDNVDDNICLDSSKGLCFLNGSAEKCINTDVLNTLSDIDNAKWTKFKTALNAVPDDKDVLQLYS